MEHPFFPSTNNRAEALRWLTISEKMLATRDFMGCKSFANRARDSDPTLTLTDQILAVVETLLVGDSRIGNNQQDWYSILRLTPQQGRDAELIDSQYRNLALILNPQRNKYPFAEQAFRLVVDAWSVLSDPSRKSIYDKEISFYLHQEQQQPQTDPFRNPIPSLPQNLMFFGASGPSNVAQPQVHASGSHSGVMSHLFQFQPIQAPQRVDPASLGSNREQQNFLGFASASNVGFGPVSGSMPSQEAMYKRTPSNYSVLSNKVAFAPWSNKERESVKQKESLQDCPNVSDKTRDNLCAGKNVVDGREELDGDINGDPNFWTTCPYCFFMYEYSRQYVDCTLRCQNCKRAFQAVVIPSPPPTIEGQDGFYSCWCFLPFGVSMENWEKNKATASTWTPFSPMLPCPQAGRGRGKKSSTPRVYYDIDDDDVIEISESSDSDDQDWRYDKTKKKKTTSDRGRPRRVSNRSEQRVSSAKFKNASAEDVFDSPNEMERPIQTTLDCNKNGAISNARKQPGRIAKNFDKLDLNVEFSNEIEEPITKINQGSVPVRGEEDNIEGIGFFEGLDEFLSSLPILNAVSDDKVVKSA